MVSPDVIMLVLKLKKHDVISKGARSRAKKLSLWMERELKTEDFHPQKTDNPPPPCLHLSGAFLQEILQYHDKPPLCSIADIFFGWTASVAKELGVFHAIFRGAGAFGLACYYSVWSALPHRNLDDDDLGYFELQDFKEASRMSVTQLPLSILQADGILFNTVEEIDQIGLMYFRQKPNLPAWPIRPVLLSAENRAGSSAVSKHFYKDWLDTRPPTGFDIHSEFNTKEWLPQGFEDRIKDSKKGLIVQKLAP